MAMAGWKTNDMLNGIEGVMNLAAASGEDLATTSDIVTDAMTAFGLSASGTTTVIKDGFSKEVANATHFADVLAQASSNSNTNVSMLGESFKYAAPVAGALGYSVEDTAIALGLMANSGIKASAGGTALRTMLTNLAKPTDTIADAMDYLGISLQNSDGSMKSLMGIMNDLRGSFGQCKMPMDEFQASLADIEARYASGELTEKKYNDAVADLTEKAYGAEGALKAKYAATLAGKEGMSGLLAIVSAAPEDFEKLTNSIYDSDGAAENMSNDMQNNLSGQLTILKSQINEVAIQIGTILKPTIKSIVSTIQEWVQKFSDLDEGTKKTIVQVGAVVAAIGPLLLVVGKLITFSASVSTGLGTLSAAFAKAGIGAASAGTSTGAFSTILAAIASPVGIAVAAVAALVAGLGYVAVTNEDVRNSLLNVWKTFKANLQPAIEYISGTVLPDLRAAWDSLLKMLKPLQEFVMNALTSAWNDILIPVLEWLAGTVLPQLLDTFKNLWENVLRPLAEFIGSILQPAFEEISEVLTTLWNNVLVPLAKFITGTLMTAWNAIYNILNKKVIPKVNSVITVFEELWNNTLKPIVDWLQETLLPIFESVFEAIGNVIGNVSDALEEVIGFVQDVFSGDLIEGIGTAFNGAKNVATTAFEGLKTGAGNLMSGAKDVALSAANAAKSGISTAFNGAKSAATSAFSNLKTSAGNLMSGAKDVALSAANAAKSGISTAFNGAKSAATSAFNGMKSSVSSIMTSAKSALVSAADAARSGISTAFNGAKSAATSAFNGMKDSASLIMGKVETLFSGAKLSLPEIATGALETARAAASGAIEKISNIVNGIKLTLPKIGGGGISLPHVSMSGSFSLSPPSIPHFSVSWYKDGGIMTRPTAFGARETTLFVGGEAGDEAILPLAPFYQALSTMLDAKFEKLQQSYRIQVTVVNEMDGEVIAEKTTELVADNIVKEYDRRR